MKFFEDADYPEIAEKLGVRVPQAHVIVHRALRRLGRELVSQMASAHGASECADALAKMAGLGGNDDEHADTPCPTCRPAWDEIVALRIGAWIPGPLLWPIMAARHRAHRIHAHLFNRLAGRLTPNGSLTADLISRAAVAALAVGVASTSLTPASGHTVPLRPAVTRPAPVTLADTRMPAAKLAVKPASRPVVRPAHITEPQGTGKAKSVDVVNAGGNHVTPPNGNEPPAARNDSYGGVIVCPGIGQSCDPPPPSH
ncbi:MAG: hypothetical protein NVSMB57_08340 [Actinomycetota bacterium]